MTYLNDVGSDDGGTTVTHYNLEIQPKRGLTLIWPAEWTHAHKGSVLRKNSKYIMTGWMHPFVIAIRFQGAGRRKRLLLIKMILLRHLKAGFEKKG